MKTNRITELLQIRFPIFQAPMGRTAPPRLAAAVTNAGGLGMLGTSWDTGPVMREKIRATRALTRGPFAVNLAMPWDQHERLEIALEEGVIGPYRCSGAIRHRTCAERRTRARWSCIP